MVPDFYTNVVKYGNNILYRGIKDGRRVNLKISYQPTLYIPSKTESIWKTLEGHNLEPITFPNIKDASDFVRQYNGVKNFNIYGNTNYAYAWLAENFHGIVDWDKDYIKISSMDIETGSENGFPDPKKAIEPITAITIADMGGAINVFGVGSYDVIGEEHYHKCRDEIDLCERFIQFWMDNYPDILTGWNCIPCNQFVWGESKITKISELSVGDNLWGRDVLKISPVSKKGLYEIFTPLTNKTPALLASGDHKIPVRSLLKGKYSDLSCNRKTNIINRILTVESIMDDDIYDNYIELPIHENKNIKNERYTNSQLYLAGLVYTDGSARVYKNEIKSFRIYQSDYDMLSDICSRYDTSSIYGPWKGCYNISFNIRELGECCELIYDDMCKKKLDIELLSRLSYEQFIYFMSGMLDGDGYISSGCISFCNYNNDIMTVHHLLLWNGILSSVSGNGLSIKDLQPSDFMLLKMKRWSKFHNACIKRKNTSSNNIKYRLDGDSYFVKITSVKKCGESVDMMDIETTDNLFVSNGYVVHNCRFFDIPYLYNRITSLLGVKIANKLSPWDMVKEKKTFQRLTGKEQTSYDLVGVAHLDYLELYKNFAKNGKSQENYQLNTIVSAELGDSKISYEEYDNLHQLYKRNHQKFIEYNVKDSTLILRLEDKLKLIELALTLAYDTKSMYEDVFTQTRMWDANIYNYLLEKHIIVPPKDIHEKDAAFEGAYVKVPQVGKHNYIASFDLNSLYPHLIQQYNISPETLIEPHEYTSCMRDILKVGVDVEKLLTKSTDLSGLKNVTVTPNGQFFRTDKQGFLPEMLHGMYLDRKKYKKLMLEAEQEYENVLNEIMKRGLV